MPDSTVRQDGSGDFTTLAAALADAGTGAGDTITIDGLWTVNDTAPATVADDNILIIINPSDPAYHDGIYDTTQEHYRLRDETDGTHAITVNNDGCTIDGLAISQEGDISDEGVRMAASGGVLNVENCIVWGDTNISDQDGIFSNVTCTVNVINCIVYDWGRGGVKSQPSAGMTQTWNVNSSTVWRNGRTFSVQGGGISMRTSIGAPTVTVNVFNTISVQNDNTALAEDYHDLGNLAVWSIDNCMDGDGSITDEDPGAVDPLQNRIATDNPAPGVGDFVIFMDITGAAPLDLLLVDNATDNDAQDAHSNTIGAGLTLPILDITADTRERGANEIDMGADSIPAPVPPDEPGLPEYGQGRAAIGDPSVYGATIVRS